MSRERFCDICGISSKQKEIRRVHEFLLCPKHKAQYYRHGCFTDPTQGTTSERNEIIHHDDYAEIVIKNKRNEVITTSKIDLDDIEKVSKYKWRIDRKYVVTGDTKNGKQFLHRMVLDYSGPLEVDHINLDVLDNRKENLRIVTRAINAQNKNFSHIQQTANGKYRAGLVRFNKYYGLGSFYTEEDAKNAVDTFLESFKEKEQALSEQFEQERVRIPNIRRTKNGTYTVNIIRNGIRKQAHGISSIEQAIAAKNSILASF